MICPHCGTRNSTRALFCRNCRAALAPRGRTQNPGVSRTRAASTTAPAASGSVWIAAGIGLVFLITLVAAGAYWLGRHQNSPAAAPIVAATSTASAGVVQTLTPTPVATASPSGHNTAKSAVQLRRSSATATPIPATNTVTPRPTRTATPTVQLTPTLVPTAVFHRTVTATGAPATTGTITTQTAVPKGTATPHATAEGQSATSPTTTENAAVRTAVLRSNTAWVAAMSLASAEGLSAIKTGSNLRSALAQVADLQAKHEHYVIHLAAIDVLWTRIMSSTAAQALLRKTAERRDLYQDGKTTPLSTVTESYTNLYNLQKVGGRWLVASLVQDIDASTVARLMAMSPTPTTEPTGHRTPVTTPEGTVTPIATAEGTATPAPSQTSTATALAPTNGQIRQATRRVVPALVRVETSAATGAGLIVESGGSGSYILVAGRLVAGVPPDGIQLTGPTGTTLTILGIQETADGELAIIHVQETDLPVAIWAAAAATRPGQQVLSLGYPLSEVQTSTPGSPPPPTANTGVILALQLSATGQAMAIEHTSETLATGSGPLVDLNGLVIGFNTQSAGQVAGSFVAIASEQARPAFRSLINALAALPLATAHPLATANPLATAHPQTTGSPTAIATETAQLPQNDPIAVVRAFYRAVTARNYSTAFAMLSRSLQQSASTEQQWAAQFATETSITVSSATLISSTNTSAVVSVTLQTTWTSGDVQRRYNGPWRLIREGGEWKLDQPNLRRVRP